MRRAPTRGFTMIEMLIAIVVSSIAVAALYSIFTVQSRQFVYQDLQMEMHQNLRFAVDILTRTLRLAGHDTNGVITGVMGEASDDDDLPALLSFDAGGPDGETDAVTVVYGDPNLLMTTNGSVVPDCATSTLEFRAGRLDYGARLEEFTAGELMLCFDYADVSGMETYMWSLSSDPDVVNGIVNVTPNDVRLDYAAVCPPGENLTPLMNCTKAHVMTFYVDNDEADGVGPGSAEHPVLMLDLNMSWPNADDVPLVDDIEDLQLQYCVDVGGAGVDCSVASNWTDAIPAGEEANVWMVRVAVVARSSRGDPAGVYQNHRYDLMNHAHAESWDNYYRTVITTEVTVRNLRVLANL